MASDKKQDAIPETEIAAILHFAEVRNEIMREGAERLDAELAPLIIAALEAHHAK